MISFDAFKAAARRYKYETAFDTDGGRVSYAELYDLITAVFNSVTITGVAGGRATLLTRDPLTAVTVALGCVRAGCALTVADPRLCFDDVRVLAAKGADIVFIPANEMNRIGPLFADAGCKIAVVSGRASADFFPAVFEYAELLKRNGFPSDKRSEHDGTLTFNGGGTALVSKLEIAPRTPVRIEFPAYSPEFFEICSALLTDGRRCSATAAPAAGCAVICDKRTLEKHVEKQEAFAVAGMPAVYAGGGLLDAETLSRRVSGRAGEPAKIEFDGERLRVIITTAGEHVLAPALKSALADLLYPYACKRTLVFRKKTN